MDKEYFLDLATLLKYLEGMSALLQTTFPAANNREQLRGQVFARNGQILECCICNQDGALLQRGADAQKILQTKKQWYVQIDNQIETTLQTFLIQRGVRNTASYKIPEERQNNTGKESGQYIPRQKNPLRAEQIQRFTRQERTIIQMVLVAIDGKQNIEQLKKSLRLPPEHVEGALNILHSIDIIE